MGLTGFELVPMMIFHQNNDQSRTDLPTDAQHAKNKKKERSKSLVPLGDAIIVAC
jgi:hypothetical protein